MQVTSGIQCNLLSPSYSTIYAPQGDAKSRFVLIQLLQGAAPWEVPAGASVIIRAAKPDGTFCFYDTNEAGESAYTISGSTVTIELVGQVLAAPGPVLMQIDFYNADGAHLSTFSFCCQVSESVVSDDDIVSSNYFSVLTATLTEMLQIEQAVKAAYGAPLVAATAAAMTDHTRIYVYTGSESGYTNGNWYYWDGRAWASGGVYNSSAINVDTTPTQGSTNPVSSGGAFNAERYNREVSEVANWLVDYNYFNAAVESSNRYDYMKIGIDRKKTRFVFDCQYDLGYAVHVKLSNALERATSTSIAKAWDNGFNVKAGHLYHIIMRHISGSVTVAEGVSYPSLRVYTLGASSDASVERGYVDDDTYIVEYYANADATINIVLYVPAHTQFDAYTVEIIMEDVTCAFAVDKRAVTSNIEYNTTASKSYAVGQYLFVGQTLYKVTAAIASDETIVPGTNVVATTIMDEIRSLAQAIN